MSDDSSLPTRLATAGPPLGAVALRTLDVFDDAVESKAPARNVVAPLSAASNRAGLGALATRLEEVRDWMRSDLQHLERQLDDICSIASDDVARRAAAHLLARPGKRIRPLCVMLGAQLAGVQVDQRVRNAAVACELVHAATLLHDDVIDEGTERRGAAAARMVYGNSASILGGDYLLIEALERVARAAAQSDMPARAELLPSLLDTVAQMVAAEALQLEMRGSFRPDLSIYMQIIDGKTAALFRWALTAAALLGSLPEHQRTALARAGTALGLAFQLIDDVLDLEGDASDTGKDLFADLHQGKLTWPLILATSRDDTLADEVRELCARSDNGEVDATAAAAIVQRIRRTGALADTRAFANEQRAEAREALNQLPHSAARRALALVIDAAVERRH